MQAGALCHPPPVFPDSVFLNRPHPPHSPRREAPGGRQERGRRLWETQQKLRERKSSRGPGTLGDGWTGPRSRGGGGGAELRLHIWIPSGRSDGAHTAAVKALQPERWSELTGDPGSGTVVSEPSITPSGLSANGPQVRTSGRPADPEGPRTTWDQPGAAPRGGARTLEAACLKSFNPAPPGLRTAPAWISVHPHELGAN